MANGSRKTRAQKIARQQKLAKQAKKNAKKAS